MTAQITRADNQFTGTIQGEMGTQDIGGPIDGDTLTWSVSLTKPVSIKLGFEAKVEGEAMTGTVKLGMFGKARLTGKRSGQPGR